MTEKIFAVILIFTLLFIAFNPEYMVPDAEMPRFSDVFVFGYEIIVGPFEIMKSAFDGPDAFVSRFSQWRSNVFGEITLLDFLDNITDRVPVLRNVKNFVESVIAPLEDVFGDLSEWIRKKLD